MHARAFDRSIRQDLKQLVDEVQHKYPQLVPGLAIVQVGGRDDSNVYIRMKIRAAAEIGITAQHINLPRTVTQSELLAKVSNKCWLLKLLYAKIEFHLFTISNYVSLLSLYSWMNLTMIPMCTVLSYKCHWIAMRRLIRIWLPIM